MADITNNQKNTVGIENITSGNDLVVNIDGSLNVVPLVNPPAPANTVAVTITGFGDVASTSGEDVFHTITNTKILTVQSLIAGSEESTGGSVVELFYDPNANLTGMTRVSTIFVNGTSDNTPVQQNFTGNGTRRMVLRRRGFSGSAREMFAQFIGYEA
jgi:hypothetical protein